MAETSGSRRTAPAPRVASWARTAIEDLPREALLRVLSRLDAREAVRTCVLAPLWRDLWRDAHRISASRDEFPSDVGDEYRKSNVRFKRFVNHLLMLRNPAPLDEFRLCHNIGLERHADEEEANLWVRHALLCNAWCVEVSVWGFRWEPDPAVFTSNHLRDLWLSGCELSAGFFRQLEMVCPVLERLVLENCSIWDTEISSQTLKVLFIGVGCHFTFGPDCKASISTPRLISLGFFGVATNITPLLETAESLLTASVAVGCFPSEDIIPSDDDLVDDICQFLDDLSGVTELGFYFEERELNMENDLDWCPIFNNLKFLTLGKWCLDADFYALLVFLQNSPGLVQLTLDFKSVHSFPGKIEGELRERSFTCEHLNSIILDKLGHRDSMVDSLEKFLLENGITKGQIHIKHEK